MPADARRARIEELISAFDAQGIHRTATPVDSASGDWLRKLAELAGGEARLVPFALDRVDVSIARLTAGDRTIEGLPFFDGGFTGDSGIAGRLGPAGSPAGIALVTLDRAAIGTEGQSIAALRRQASLRGIVAVTAGGAPGLCPSNARSFAQPFGIPVLQVGSEHQGFLNQVAATSAPVTLVAAATRTPAQAFNVVATVAGRQPDLAPLLVMTPRSGWWECASERGGGLACWIEALRAVSAAKPARPAIFLASSGHELGHHGLYAFLRAHPDLIKGARAWIHLGANIGAAGGQTRLQASDDEIEASTLRTLEEAGASVSQHVPRGTVPSGEARNIHVGGGRYVSLLGGGPAFHTLQDRWPAAVDVGAVARFAEAVSALAVTLTRG
ncbi:MAG: hypothetical protein ABSB35_07645 [Bryobacteraceae bacterium]